MSELDDPEFVTMLQEEYIAEASDTLNECEVNLMNLEKNPNSEDDKLSYKRALHTMKGSSQAVGLSKSAEIIHYLETTLEGSLTHEIIDFHLKSVDVLRDFCKAAVPGEATKAEYILDRIKG